MSNPAAFHGSRRLPERMRRQKARNLGLMHALGAQFGFVLGSFSTCCLCFQWHTGFDRIILYLSSVPGYPSCRDFRAIRRGSSLTGPRLRQCVHKMTIVVGYHRPRILSSEKCRKNEGATLCRVQEFRVYTERHKWWHGRPARAHGRDGRATKRCAVTSVALYSWNGFGLRNHRFLSGVLGRQESRGADRAWSPEHSR